MKKRYADPVEREKLLQRLLSDHHSKNNSKASTPKSDHNEAIENASNDSHISESFPPHALNDTLFYASEITPTKRYPSESPQSTSPNSSPNQNLEDEDDSIENDSMNSSNSARRSNSRYGSGNMNRTIRTDSTFVQGRGGHENDRRRHLKTKEDLIKEAKEEFNRQYTFQPQLNTSIATATPTPSHGTTINRRESTTSKPKRSSSVNRIDAMLRVHEQKLLLRDKQRLEVERAQVELFCTFKPEICPGTNQILQKKYVEDEYNGKLIQQQQQQEMKRTRSSSLPPSRSAASRQSPNNNPPSASQRLFSDAKKKLNKQHLIQTQLSDISKSEYPFHPSINPKTNAILAVVNGSEYRPLYERVGEIQRSSMIHKQVLANSYEDELRNAITFRPKIDEKSAQMILEKRLKQSRDAPSEGKSNEEPHRFLGQHSRGEDGGGGDDVGRRLLDEGRKQLLRKHQLLAERERELANQMKEPKPCKGSQEILEQNPAVWYCPSHPPSLPLSDRWPIVR
jgi:hypothetical protein